MNLSFSVFYDLLNPLKPDTKFLVFFCVTIQPLNGRLTMTDTKMSASKNSVGRLPNNSERLFSLLINDLLTKGFGDMDPYDVVVKLRDLCANNQLTHAQLNAANAENERFKRLLQANNIPVEPVAVTTTPTSTKVRKRALGNRALAKKQKTGKKRVVVDLSRSVPTKNNELLYDPYFPVPMLKKPPSYSKENIVDHANLPKATPTPKKKKSTAKKPPYPTEPIFVDETTTWEQSTLTQIYPPILKLPEGDEEDDWLTQARI